METSTYTVGEDCRKVREVPSHGGTMCKLVEGTAKHLRHVCGLRQHGWGKMDNRKLEPVGLLRKKVRLVWGAAPCPGIFSISISCPFLGEGAQQHGQPLNAVVAQAVMVWQKPLSPHCHDLL